MSLDSFSFVGKQRKLRTVFSEVFKKDGEISMTCKAYNGRVVMHWLSEVVVCATEFPAYVQRDERFILIAAALRLD